jgi:hypothetical protein
MSEIEREGILEQRLEEMQRVQDTRNLDQLVKAQKVGDSDGVKTKRMSLSYALVSCHSLVIKCRYKRSSGCEQPEKPET